MCVCGGGGAMIGKENNSEVFVSVGMCLFKRVTATWVDRLVTSRMHQLRMAVVC